MARLFFALHPQPAERSAIDQVTLPLAQALGAKPTPAVDLHLTLAFLGNVPAENIPELRRAAAGVESGPIQLALSRIDCWERPGVLCLLPDEDVSVHAVAQLARTLAESARAVGLTPDENPFRPHVTVARKVPRARARGQHWPQLLPVTLRFTARGVVLMESTRDPEGPRYTVIHAWPAAPADV